MALAACGRLPSLAAAGAGQLARLAARSDLHGRLASAMRAQCASARCVTGITSKLQAAASAWRAAASRLDRQLPATQPFSWHRPQLQRAFAAAAAGQEGGPGQEKDRSAGGQESGGEGASNKMQPTEGELDSEEEFWREHFREEGNTWMDFTARWMLDGCGSFEEMRHAIR